MKLEFETGDRVRALYDYLEGNYSIKAGMTGTICDPEPSSFFLNVYWDDNVNGHSCDGRCPHGYGWNVKRTSIALIPEESFAEIPVDEFADFLNM